jgi:hypothetical protein
MRCRVKPLSCCLFVIGVAFALQSQPAEATLYTFEGHLDAAQVVDGGGSTSTATGFAHVVVDPSTFTIVTDLSWTGLSGPADRAHMHDAPQGQSRLNPPNGQFEHELLSDVSLPIAQQVPCGFVGQGFLTNCTPTTGSAHDVLDPNSVLGQTFGTGYGYPSFTDLLNVFLNGGIYIDMHTSQYPSGEIRGQLFAVVPEPTGIGLTALGMGMLLAGVTRRRVAGGPRHGTSR